MNTQTEKTTGSSETPRETTLKDLDFTAYIDAYHPRTQGQENVRQFLQWFVGFSEGDGSFIVTTNNRLMFICTQNDKPLLQKMRTRLGFGKVSAAGKYWRYIVADQRGVARLITLFNGNLHLEKTNRRFRNWLNAYNAINGNAIEYAQRAFPCHENSSWCSGFIEAEGCFNAQRIVDSRYSLGYRVRLRFVCDQQGERPVLQGIQQFLCAGSVSRRISEDGVDDMWRLWSWSLASHRVLQRYLSAHPLRGKKGRAALRFFRLHSYICNRKTLPWKGKVLARVERLIDSINRDCPPLELNKEQNNRELKI